MLKNSKTPALSRAIAILDYIAKEGTCSALDIHNALEIPKSSLYVILDELCDAKFIIKNEQGNFSLWLKLVELSSHVLDQIDLRAIAKPFLTELMEKTGLMCHLGILNQSQAFYILKVESYSTIRVHSYEGKALALERSGIGKCLLAFQPEQVIQNVVKNLKFVAKTPTSIASESAYLQELELIRNRGWSFDDSEDVEGVRCIAAPIFNLKGKLEAAISIVGASMQIDDSNKDEFVRLTVQCAQKISNQLSLRTGNI
ncbi:IclR family transcriptional regulator [Acinetobacter sp. MB5]|uniref:IclR family transcriptional regulator n=1 Tax=Acinetobacter sp. MB5 TaxID=2069438 RepID=UPI000DD02D44|nr:IclR family transcriptional regulator [Acinetobacter sp. MB5]